MFLLSMQIQSNAPLIVRWKHNYVLRGRRSIEIGNLQILTLPDLSLLLSTTLSKVGVQWTPLLTHEPFALTTSSSVGY